MELISGYVWILPGAIVTGWALSWLRRSRLVRWSLLLASLIASLLCVAIAIVVAIEGKRSYIPPAQCPKATTCGGYDLGPFSWLAAAVLGFGCCLILVGITFVAELGE